MMRTALRQQEATVALVSIFAYITIYSFEAPIRYGLFLIGFPALILCRDLLMVGPLVYIALRQALERRIHPALTVFTLLIAIQGCVFYLNFREIGPALLGGKLLINVALGLLVGSLLINCSKTQARLLLILFLSSCAGLLIEKFITPFPWVGITINIGGLDVPISLDWQSGDELTRRVGGFTRESINAASLVPFLAFLVIPRVRSVFWRTLMVVFTVGSVFLTTQKGALAAAALISLCLLLPVAVRMFALRVLVLTGMVAQIVLPFATSGMMMSEGSGDVFTASSFAARVLYTWPSALRFVAERSVGPFGVGLGGSGGPMRLITPIAAWMFADNMFIFVYAFLGVFAAVFYGAVVCSVWRSLLLPDEIAEPALATIAFVMWYGTVITGLEDQMLSLATGASLGALLNLERRVPARAGGMRQYADQPA